MLKQRILTAAVLIPMILAAIYYAPHRLFVVLIGIVVLIAAWEWAKLSGLRRPLFCVFYLLLIVVLFISLNLIGLNYSIALIAGVSVGWWLWSLLLIIRYQRNLMQFKKHTLLFLVVGILILLPFWFSTAVLHLSQQFPTASAHLLLFIIALVALADTTAYFVGKHWGKHKLASRVSPGKTWEGLLGAIVMVSGLVVPLSHLLHMQNFSKGELFFIAVMVVLSGLIGDLFESLVKRVAGVKDSGRILPGHGGILDRIDAYTAAIPIFLAIYLYFQG